MNSSNDSSIYINFDPPLEESEADYAQLPEAPARLSRSLHLEEIEEKHNGNEAKSSNVDLSPQELAPGITATQIDELFTKMNIKSNAEKILLAMGTSYSLTVPLTFINGIRLFPLLSHRLYQAITRIFIYVCLLPPEDLEAIVYDTTTVEVEALASTFVLVLIEILTAVIMLMYISGEYLWKRSLLKELNGLLKDLNLLKEAGVSNWQDLPRHKLKSVISVLRRDSFDIRKLETLSIKTSTIRKKAEDLRQFRKELHRYVNIVVAFMAIPGLYFFIKKSSSLAKKIDCNISTLAVRQCTIDRHISILAQIVWLWMATSFGVIAYTAIGTMGYYFTPRKIAKWFNDTVHQPLIKFFKLRDEDAVDAIYRVAVWNAAYRVILPSIAFFAVFGAITTANLYAEDTKCPGYFKLGGIILTNGFFDFVNMFLGTNLQIAFDKECPESEAALELGVAIADGEMVTAYPYFQMLKFLVFMLAIPMESGLRRVWNIESIKNFISNSERIHEESLAIAFKAILAIGVPLFWVSLRFAMNILTKGVTVIKHLDNSLIDDHMHFQPNVTMRVIAEDVCPANPQALIDVLNGEELSNLSNATMPEFINNSTFIFPISEPCPQYANLRGVTYLLSSNALGFEAPGCPTVTVSRFESTFAPTYWTGILATLAVFYVGPYIYKAVKGCIGCRRKPRENVREGQDNENIEMKSASNPNSFFAGGSRSINSDNRWEQKSEMKQSLLSPEEKLNSNGEKVSETPSRFRRGLNNIYKWWSASPVTMGAGIDNVSEMVSTPRSSL